MSTIVRDNPEAGRYEILEDDKLASLVNYRVHGSVVDLLHTETLDGFGGRGLAGRLIRETLADQRLRGRQVRPFCPFARDYIAGHPEYRDLVPAAERARFDLAEPAPDTT